MKNDLAHDGRTTNEQLATALSEALRNAATSAIPGVWEKRVSLLNPHAPTSAENESLVLLEFAGELSGCLLLSADARFADKLRAPGENASSGEAAMAWEAFARQATEPIATALQSLFGEITVESCRTAVLPEDAEAFATMELQHAGGEKGTITVHTDAALRASLERLAPGSHASSELLPLGNGGQLRRVIDVPLAVTLRFGQRQLTLRELLALSSGSLVELDRQVEEPVDLMLGERVVARGEVVIVDGNYGMRVTQVIENANHRRSHIPR